MQLEHLRFPSIEAYKNAVKSVQKYMSFKNLETYEPVEYTGSVKLHGTNAAFVYAENGDYNFQSRERILSLDSDNAGFFVFGESNKADLIKIANSAKLDAGCEDGTVAIYGEFIGPGINKGVAVNNLNRKIFYIFAIKINGRYVNDEILKSIVPTDNIRVILQDSPAYNITIDFMRPSEFTEILESYTAEVELECPIGKFHGISGVGEGIVYVPTGEKRNISELWFKVKGEKHSASKTTVGAKTKAPDLKTVMEIVEAVVTLNRLNQGLSYLQEMNLDTSSKNTGTFIGWVMKDIAKEDSDVIMNSGLDWKSVQGHLADKARKFYLGLSL